MNEAQLYDFYITAGMAVLVAKCLAITEAVFVGTTLFCCPTFWDMLNYNNDKQVVDCIAALAPLLCLFVFMDSLQAVPSGPFFFNFFIL